MSSKGKIRQKRHQRQLAKKLGACRICAPMLLHPVGDATNDARINCPKCGREIVLDGASQEAVDTLVQCLLETGDFCTKTYRYTNAGQVEREGACDCGKLHIDIQAFATSAAGMEEAHG